MIQGRYVLHWICIDGTLCSSGLRVDHTAAVSVVQFDGEEYEASSLDVLISAVTKAGAYHWLGELIAALAS